MQLRVRTLNRLVHEAVTNNVRLHCTGSQVHQSLSIQPALTQTTVRPVTVVPNCTNPATENDISFQIYVRLKIIKQVYNFDKKADENLELVERRYKPGYNRNFRLVLCFRWALFIVQASRSGCSHSSAMFWFLLCVESLYFFGLFRFLICAAKLHSTHASRFACHRQRSFAVVLLWCTG